MLYTEPTAGALLLEKISISSTTVQEFANKRNAAS